MAITDTREQIIRKRGYRDTIHGEQYILYLSNYSVAARYLASRLKGETLLELCCALGVTLEAVSHNFNKLIGVDSDPKVLEDCRKNLTDTGVINKVTLLQRDITDEALYTEIKADVAIYDIPYWVAKELPDGSNVLDKNPDLVEIIAQLRKYVCSNIVIFAPTYMEYTKVKEQLGECEYEQIYINGKYDRNYIYFGNLIKQIGITRKELVTNVS